VYTLDEHRLMIVATDRISAFDHILRQPIPYKGQLLNLIAAYFFDQVNDIVPTHLISVPHPNISVTQKCTPLPVEIVVRGFLAGHAWRRYNEGKRELCGVRLPEGLRESEAFAQPILTPTTKATEGHDADISEYDIVRQHLVDPSIWEQIRTYAFQLFERGQQIARKQGLMLVDTKYEFGLFENKVVLIDEVHTPDSSRYYYLDGYEERLARGERQKQLSKEFIREWLMHHGFQGLEGQQLPDLEDDFRLSVTQRYVELYEKLTGLPFKPTSTVNFNTTLDQVVQTLM
jgi:phosphoribosylaminoimidazole-succinocarboxamide synthase